MRSAADASPPQRSKSPARSNAPAKQKSQKPLRKRPTAAGLRGGGQMDSVLSAQLEAIAHGLEDIPSIRAEIEEMRTVIEELAENVAALVANSSVQNRDLERPAPAVVDEVVIVETYEDTDGDDEGSEPPGFPQD